MAATRAPYLQILVVEKERDIQTIYRKFLESAGLKPVIVNSGKECLDILFADGASFDMVIIDTHLADIDGISVAKKIRERMPSQRIIITSTFTDALAKDLELLGVSEKDVLVKPFRFAQLLSLIKPNTSRVGKIGLTDHILAFYDSPEEEMREAFAFIKSAVRNNETTLFVIRKDVDVDDLKARMAEDGIEIDRLLSTNALILVRNEDWYIPDRRVDKKRIIAQWYELVDNCTGNGTKGLKAFCMMDCFFENGFAEEMVDYEQALPAKFDIPFVPICAYRRQDVDKLSEDQLKRLMLCHNHVWTAGDS
ncbi:MAG: MEDS domain-containing protein [Nitrososphaera sp.]